MTATQNDVARDNLQKFKYYEATANLKGTGVLFWTYLYVYLELYFEKFNSVSYYLYNCNYLTNYCLTKYWPTLTYKIEIS